MSRTCYQARSLCYQNTIHICLHNQRKTHQTLQLPHNTFRKVDPMAYPATLVHEQQQHNACTMDLPCIPT